MSTEREGNAVKADKVSLKKCLVTLSLFLTHLPLIHTQYTHMHVYTRVPTIALKTYSPNLPIAIESLLKLPLLDS